VIGLLACLAAPIPPLADLLAASAWLPAAWIAATATTTAAVPGAQVLVVPGIGMALLVGLLSAAVGALLVRSRAGAGPPVPVTRGAALIVAVAVALFGANAVLTGPLAPSTVTDEWSIAACDVGQGDALLVRSAGEVALIDTGPDPGALEECLRSLGVDRLDLLVLTHFDLDHVGGAASIFGRAETVLHGPAGEPADERLLEELAQGGADLVDASAGQRGTLGEASWRVLWPRRDSAAFPAGNDASVVMSFSGGGVPTSLFLGDLSATPQRMLMASGLLGQAYAVVKVAHHGSADQDSELYGRLHPAAAIFSAGTDNDYGHPRKEALALLQAAGAVVLRTDQQGRLLLGMRDGELVVWTERSVGTSDSTTDVEDPG
jgi:competence protein ComEC